MKKAPSLAETVLSRPAPSAAAWVSRRLGERNRRPASLVHSVTALYRPTVPTPATGRARTMTIFCGNWRSRTAFLARSGAWRTAGSVVWPNRCGRLTRTHTDRDETLLKLYSKIAVAHNKHSELLLRRRSSSPHRPTTLVRLTEAIAALGVVGVVVAGRCDSDLAAFPIIPAQTQDRQQLAGACGCGRI